MWSLLALGEGKMIEKEKWDMKWTRCVSAAVEWANTIGRKKGEFNL